MLRIPFFIEARTLSWSTRDGKLKDRENSPTLRSETQNLASDLAGFPSCVATLVLSFSAFVLSLWCFPSLPSVIVPDGVEPSSMNPAGGSPEEYERSV